MACEDSVIIMRIEQSCGKDVVIYDTNAELEQRIADLEAKNTILEDNMTLTQQMLLTCQEAVLKQELRLKQLESK